MSALLALAAASAGTAFQCTADTAHFTLFAPAEEVTAGYRGNVLTLYSIEGDGEILPPPVKMRQVFDNMPHDLYLELTADDVAVEIEIGAVDTDAGTATTRVSGTRGEETMSVEGSCTLATSDGKEAA